MSPEVQRFFDRKKAAPLEMAGALAEVAHTMTAGGGFSKHLQEGQGEWAPLSPSYAAQKGSARIFVLTGTVARAIRSDASGGVAKVKTNKSGVPNKITYTKNGLYVYINGLAVARPLLVIGFSGRYKHSAKFKAARKEGHSDIEIKGRGVKKHAKPSKSAQGLPNAQVVQAGVFQGRVNKKGQKISAKELAFQSNKLRKGDLFERASARRRLKSFSTEAGAKDVRGTPPRPLLPAKDADIQNVYEALLRGAKEGMRLAGIEVT